MYRLHYYCEARESSMLNSHAITHITHTHMHQYVLTSAKQRTRGTNRLLEWSGASLCFQPLWSGWRYPSGTCWWWSRRSQPGSGLRLSVFHSGRLGFPRWCDLFYEALPHMRFQLLVIVWFLIRCVWVLFLHFFLVGMEKEKREREKREREIV